MGRHGLRGLVEAVRRPLDFVHRTVVVGPQSGYDAFRSDRVSGLDDVGPVLAHGQGKMGAGHLEIQRFEEAAGRFRRRAGKPGGFDARVPDFRGQVHHAFEVLVGQCSEGVKLQSYGWGHGAAPLSMLKPFRASRLERLGTWQYVREGRLQTRGEYTPTPGAVQANRQASP